MAAFAVSLAVGVGVIFAQVRTLKMGLWSKKLQKLIIFNMMLGVGVLLCGSLCPIARILHSMSIAGVTPERSSVVQCSISI